MHKNTVIQCAGGLISDFQCNVAEIGCFVYIGEHLGNFVTVLSRNLCIFYVRHEWQHADYYTTTCHRVGSHSYIIIIIYYIVVY